MNSIVSGHIGFVHIAASVASLIFGTLVLATAKGTRLHFNFMYWSVIGLYAALCAETLTRIPGQKFFSMVGWATLLVFACGQIAFFFYKKKWKTVVAQKTISDYAKS